MGTAITDFRPMLAKAEIVEAIDKGAFASGWVMEPKHDGMRAIVEVDSSLPGGIRISSRSGLGYTEHLFLSHRELLKEFIPDGSIIDGELAAIKRFVEIEDVAAASMDSEEDWKRVPVVDFNRTMRIMGSGAAKAQAKQKDGLVTFLVFDVVKWKHMDVTASSWHARRALIEELQSFHSEEDVRTYGGTPPIVVNPYFEVDRGVYEKFLEHKIEGAIMKFTPARYQPGKRPSKTWVKLKAEQTFDVIVMGFTDGRGKYEGQIGAIEFGAYDADGELKYVGRCSGMDDKERRIWSDARDIWDEDEHAGQFVIEVKANEMVGSGEYRTPRHPQYVILRTDKKPEECTMEQFKADER